MVLIVLAYVGPLAVAIGVTKNMTSWDSNSMYGDLAEQVRTHAKHCVVKAPREAAHGVVNGRWNHDLCAPFARPSPALCPLARTRAACHALWCACGARRPRNQEHHPTAHLGATVVQSVVWFKVWCGSKCGVVWCGVVWCGARCTQGRGRGCEH